MFTNALTRFSPAALVLAFTFCAVPNEIRADDYCGHYESRVTQVLVCAAHTENVWCAPVYRSIYYCGNYSQVLVTPGYYRSYFVPARYETRYVRFWVSGSNY